jgi:hypothetical protein
MISDSRHWNFKTAGVIQVPSRGHFRFPITGSHRGDAVMSAVDESGTSVIKYRNITKPHRTRPDGIEVVVAPEADMELDSLFLLISSSSWWLRSFFATGSGG